MKATKGNKKLHRREEKKLKEMDNCRIGAGTDPPQKKKIREQYQISGWITRESKAGAVNETPGKRRKPFLVHLKLEIYIVILSFSQQHR